jgi:hypothetical protein
LAETTFSYWRTRARRQDGSIFILALTALFVLLALGAVSLDVAMQSSVRAQCKQDRSAAQALAEAGANCAEAWLRAQGYPPIASAPIDPPDGAGALSTGTYRAQIIPAAGNSMAWRKSYIIVSTGTSMRHQATSAVKMIVRQQSFALYSYFTDEEISPITNSTIWFIAADRLYGPAHTNDQFHIRWDASADAPIFWGTVSSCAATVDWNPSGPDSISQWERVIQGGQDALTLDADYIPLPEESSAQQTAAWGSESGFPSQSGVYLPVDGAAPRGGIYIQGDSCITFALNGDVGQTVSVVQGGTRTDVRTDLAGNATAVDAYTGSSGSWVLESTSHYAGLPNGVIYSTGHITSLSGTLADSLMDGNQLVTRNAWTVCTDLSNQKNITITSDLQYATHPAPEQLLDSADNLRAACLGVVANNVVVKTTANSVRIDGTILANSSFYNYYWNSGVPKGTLTVSGGIIQRNRGPVGQFSGTRITSGYSKDYHYDPRMADYPPPFFPTTGQYDVLSWQCD